MARLTTKARKALPRDDFALPAKREGGKGGYPIPNKSHARNALARVSEFGTPKEKATVRKKVDEKFPSMEKGTSEKGSHKRRSVVPRGGHHEMYHRAPVNHAEFHRLGNDGDEDEGALA